MHSLVAARSFANNSVIPNTPSEPTSIMERWQGHLRNQAAPRFLRAEFISPLAKPTGMASPWGAILLSPRLQKYFTAMNARGQQADWLLYYPLFGGYAILEGVVLSGISALIEAGLLGWLVALAGGTKPRHWSDPIRSYFLPLFVLILFMSLGMEIIITPLQFLSNYGRYGLVTGSLEILRTILGIILSWLTFFALILLAPAPFAIVGRNLGAWAGVKAGARILWQKGWIFLAIFIGYRFIYEIIMFASLASPAGYRFVVFGNYLSYSLSKWLSNIIFAFLGLWLAMCFTMLVLPKREVAKDARTI
jgi:hypothetical protein